MTDVIDSANDRAELELQRAISAARGRSPGPAVVLDECLNQCGEKPRDGSKFCSKECVEDHEGRQRHLRRQGVR